MIGIKPWYSLFDVHIAMDAIVPIWVKLPNIPFELWNKARFKAIYYSNDTYILGDMGHMKNKIWSTGLELGQYRCKQGLYKSLKNIVGNMKYTHILCYMYVPFYYCYFHCMGYFMAECSHPFTPHQ